MDNEEEKREEQRHLSPRTDWRDEIAPLRAKIENLQKDVEHLSDAYGGLRDVDKHFDLILSELTAVLLLVKRSDFSGTLEMKQVAREFALHALDLLEDITTEDIHLGQKASFLRSPELKKAHSLLKEIVLFGGGNLFRAEDMLGKKSKKIIKSVERSLFRFITPVYESAEIEEGEEDVVVSDYLLLPRSQAVLLIEDELIPQYESELSDDPGNRELQRRLEVLREQAELLKKMKFFPRARPMLMHENAGLYSDSFVQFTADGEMIVKIKIQTILGTGNKLDLLFENMKFKIVRDLIGTKWEHAPGRKPTSVKKLYRNLSYHFPFLRRLEQKDELKKLADLARSGKREEVRLALHKMMVHDRNLLWTSEPLGLDKFE